MVRGVSLSIERSNNSRTRSEPRGGRPDHNKFRLVGDRAQITAQSRASDADDHGWGLLMPDGSIVKLQVEIVADDGSTFELNDPSFFLSDSGDTLAKFSKHDLPRERKYLKVRIRSDQPINCKRIFWRNYNQWDVT